MSVASARVPVAVVSGVVCLLLGVAGGIVIGGLTNVRLGKEAAANPDEGAGKDAATSPAGMKGAGGMGGPGGAKGGGGMGGGMGGGGMGGGGMGGGRGPNPKTQLAQLVGKLDVLTRKPLAVSLTPDQKQKAKEILTGLEGKDELSEDDAKAKLDALLKVVEGQKETLESAGYRWPSQGGGGGGGGAGGGGGGGPPAPPPNPFKEGDPEKRLKSLQDTLGK
ncbi:MAG: hypothetical protein JWO38_2514 [Gemmataceae bacterium]|nr:hypothetical protein [Gemmataceae bacterium]